MRRSSAITKCMLKTSILGHGVVGDTAEVPQAAGKENVDVRRDDLELSVHIWVWIIGCEWSEQYRILQCET